MASFSKIHLTKNSPPNEHELINRLSTGDSTAYEDIVRAHGGPMLATARRMTGNEEDARDVVQEAFLSAFKSIKSFQGESGIGTWLHRITINAALMRLRARKNKNEPSLEDLLPVFYEDGHRQVPVDDWRIRGDGLVHQKEISTFVRASIGLLPQKYQTVLILRDIEEKSTKETAEMLDVSENTIKLRLHRARQALRGLMAPRLREYGT